MIKEEDFKIMRATSSVSNGNLLLWLVVILEGILLLTMYGHYSSFTDVTRIICTVVYIVIITLSFIRFFLFRKWKNNILGCYKKILILNNIYSCSLIILGSVIMLVESTDESMKQWFVMCYLLIALAVPLITSCHILAYAIILSVSYIAMIIVGLAVVQANIDLNTYVYVLVLDIFAVFVLITKIKNQIESYEIRKNAHETADIQIQVSQELLKINEILRKDTVTDSLTNLLNRTALENEKDNIWEECFIEQKPICVCMIDVDNFKTLNDTYGHMAGDICLRQVANIINENAISYNGLAFRYGGEEFLMVFKGQKVKDVEKYMSDLSQAIATTYFEEVPTIKISVSIGIYGVVPNEKIDFSNLITEADRRMYKNKNIKHKK